MADPSQVRPAAGEPADSEPPRPVPALRLIALAGHVVRADRYRDTHHVTVVTVGRREYPIARAA